MMELVVFGLEAALYLRLLGRVSPTPLKKGRIILYALAANVLSFAGGLWLAVQIPGIF